jgi:L-fucose mutarotase/ribose pyranase (RbsD/FucU family)
VIVHVVDIGGIVNHHWLEAIVHVVDIDGIVDHHCLEAIVHVSTNINNMNNRL